MDTYKVQYISVSYPTTITWQSKTHQYLSNLAE